MIIRNTLINNFFLKYKYKIINFFSKVFFENFDKKINFNWDLQPPRWDLINLLIEEFKLSNYLEVGVYKLENFKKILCKKKTGVDPKINYLDLESTEEVKKISSVASVNGNGYNIKKLTSDIFFLKCEEKFDLIFIDGLHEFSTVRRDIQNSLRVLSEGGFILVHDSLPDRLRSQMVPRAHEKWNGDIWKAIVELRTLNDLVIYTVLIDEGISVIFRLNDYKKKNININYSVLQLSLFDKLKDKSFFNFKKLQFQDYYYNYKKYLNTIALDDFKLLIKKLNS